MKTKFELWQSGNLGVGSFEEHLFSAYLRADSENAAKLELAFPELFVNPF